MTRTLTTLFSALAAFSAVASSFTDALDRLTDASLALKAQSLNSQATLQDMRNENRLPAPEAEFGYKWGSNAEAGNKWDLSVTQSFDWPGTYRARSRAIKHSSTAMDFLQKSAIVDIRMQGRLLLLDIIKTKQLLEIDQKMNADFVALEELAKKEIDQANMTKIDYNKAVIERINSSNSLRENQAALDALMQQLEALAGSREAAVGIADMAGSEYPNESIPASLSDEDLMLLDPAVEAANANARARMEMAKAEKLSRLPGFSIGFAHETEGDGSFNGPTVGISLPFFSNKGKYEAEKLRSIAADTELQLQIAQRRADFVTARLKAQKSWETVSELRPVVETETNLYLLNKARAAGQLTLREYYQEVNYFLEAHRAYHNALYQYHLALAELHRFD